MARSRTTADVFNAVAESRRRRILSLLAKGERSVNAMAKTLRFSQPQVSKHLPHVAESRPRQRSRRWAATALQPQRRRPQADPRLGQIVRAVLERKLRSIGRLPQRVADPRRKPMSTKSDASSAATDADFVLTRVFNAPRELVFQAWTKPEHMARWSGPHIFTNPVCELDVRPGGARAHRNARPRRRYAPGQGNLSGNRAPRTARLHHRPLRPFRSMARHGESQSRQNSGQAAPGSAVDGDVRGRKRQDEADDPRPLRVGGGAQCASEARHVAGLVAEPGTAGGRGGGAEPLASRRSSARRVHRPARSGVQGVCGA